MNYTYWVGVTIIMSFVSYVVFDGIRRFINYQEDSRYD